MVKCFKLMERKGPISDAMIRPTSYLDLFTSKFSLFEQSSFERSTYAKIILEFVINQIKNNC